MNQKYVKQLEQQNEQLSEKLADMQRIFDDFKKQKPIWVKGNTSLFYSFMASSSVPNCLELGRVYYISFKWHIIVLREDFTSIFNTAEEAMKAVEEYIYEGIYPDSD